MGRRVECVRSCTETELRSLACLDLILQRLSAIQTLGEFLMTELAKNLS